MIEEITERFRGHSISDPGLYRTKEALKETMAKDPILRLKKSLIEHHILTEEEYEEMDKHARDIAVAAMQFADASPWPDPITLEEGVFAPKEEGLHG